MTRSLAVCLLGLSLLLACKSRSAVSAEPKDIVTENQTTSETMGHGEIIGTVTVRGTLQHTKGRMGEVAGMIISGEYFTGEGGGAWKPEFEALVGKKVEVQGEHYRYHCSPIEQCLEGGVINYLQQIVYLKAVQ